MTSTKDIIHSQKAGEISSFHQGDCVYIRDNKDLFQVIGIDNKHEKCWLRRWPLLPHGSPVFEIPIQQIVVTSNFD